MIQGVRKHLLDAVRDRLRADVPIGVFLSGGIDSSAIAGMVKHLMDTEGAQLGTAPASERINCSVLSLLVKNMTRSRSRVVLRTGLESRCTTAR